MNRLGMTLPVLGEPLGALPSFVGEVADAGYTDVWTSETSGIDAFAPLMVTALGAPQIRLGTGIANVFSRSPALLAMNALGVAELSPEPIYIGIGASSDTIVRDWHGVPFVKPYERVRDTLRFLKSAFDGDTVTYESETFRSSGFRLERLPEHKPQILLGALRERTLTLAGAEADGAILTLLSAEDVTRVVPYVLDQNPDAVIAARIFVIIGPDRDAARAFARRFATGYLSAGVYADYHRWLGRGSLLEPMWNAWAAGDRKAAMAALPDDVLDDLFLTGTPAEIAARVEEFRNAGVAIPLLTPVGADPAAIKAAILELGPA